MKTIKSLLAAGLIFLASCPSYGAQLPEQSIPLEFKGAVLNSSEQEVKSKIPDVDCYSPTETILGDRTCNLQTTIADVPALAFFRFYSDHLSSIDLLIKNPHINFTTVTGALEEKYGTPTKVDKEENSTGAGVKFVNQILIWELETGSITVEKYSGRITSSSVRFNSSTHSAEFAKRMEDRKKTGAKDL